MNLQNNAREKAKELKWKHNISYKYIANNILNMNYNAFMNWLSGYKNLGTNKINILLKYETNFNCEDKKEK